MAVWGDKKAIPAIMGASGVTKEQAKTCLYYTIATYLLPDELDLMPILAIIGPIGTGKTDLLNQLAKMANEPKRVGGKTFAALRDKLGKTTTALFDDADDIDERILINRYSKVDSIIEHKVQVPMGWITKKTNVFGATIITKRLPFHDSAITSRSIVIKTQHKPGNYKLTRFRNVHEILRKKAEEIDLEKTEPTSHRVKNNWMPLQAIANYFEDDEWLEYSQKEIEGGVRVLKVGQSYEPEEALLLVLKVKTNSAKLSTEIKYSRDVYIREIKGDLREHFDINFKIKEIEEYLQGLGFKTTRPDGYPKVRFNEKLLNKLLERYK